MRDRISLIILSAGLLVGLHTSFAQSPTQHHHPPASTRQYIRMLEDPSRAEWQKPAEVIEKLDLKPGEAVADLGAGSGYFTIRLARAVGPRGKVYAVDINPDMLAYIARRAKQEHMRNIRTVLADPDSPKLPPSSVDLIFICDTLHHIENRSRYYPLLARALRPGGRLVDVDFHKRDLPIGPPVGIKIAKQAVIDEVKPAGFHLVKEFDFLKYQYFLIFER